MNTVITSPYISSGILTGDTLVCTGSGILHQITLAQNDAAPTAGSIIIFDSVTEANTQLFNTTLTTGVFLPVTITLDIPFSTGLYAGFTTTADVNVIITYLESSSSGVI